MKFYKISVATGKVYVFIAEVFMVSTKKIRENFALANCAESDDAPTNTTRNQTLRLLTQRGVILRSVEQSAESNFYVIATEYLRKIGA